VAARSAGVDARSVEDQAHLRNGSKADARQLNPRFSQTGSSRTMMLLNAA
jgi:hypothetical protein